ncbi:hypothetical protein KKG41_02680 [Patescibacteria group bacterium]|nr:hypothetical protein [Patescibacteria group bacterium]MBU1890042.1 hypothetical protein [Patescibacteria group bacterium]
MKSISGKGWFVATVSGLVAGDGSFVDPYNPMDLRELGCVCATLSSTGFARESRKKWWTIDHPTLGLLQWKQGVNYKNALPYLFLRLNGHTFLKAWPESGQKYTYAEWTSSNEVEELAKQRVESFLGTIQEGSNLPATQR